MYAAVESIFTRAIDYCIILLEAVGVIIILMTAAKGVWELVRQKEHVRLDIAKGIALALEFKLGSEVLRTVIVRDFHEILIAGSIVALRAVITFLIHWEIKIEEARLR